MNSRNYYHFVNCKSLVKITIREEYKKASVKKQNEI